MALQVEDTITKSPTRAPSLFDLTSPHQQQEGAEWLIPWDEIELGRRIGAGSFGEVFRAQWRHTDVAVKRITHVNESLVGVNPFSSYHTLQNFVTDNIIGNRLQHRARKGAHCWVIDGKEC